MVADPPSAASRWIPVVAVLAAILLTLPLGPTLGIVLNRLTPSAVVERVPLPSPAVEVAAVPGSAGVRFANGGVAIVHAGEVRFVDLPAPCLGLRADAGDLLCAAGVRGVIVIDAATGAVTGAAETDARATVVVRAGRQLLVGQDDGTVQSVLADGDDLVVGGRVQIDGSPITALYLMDGAALVGTRDGTLAVVALRGALAPTLGWTASLGTVSGITGYAVTGYVAAGASGVVVFDLSDLGAPRELRRIAVGDATGVSVGTGNLIFARVAPRGVVPIVSTELGVWWTQRSRGVDAELDGLSGLAPRVPALRGDTLLVLDVFPTQRSVIWGVGLLALVLLSWVGWVVWTSTAPDRTARLVWTAVGTLGLGWLLAARLDLPIEALHLLEYGVLGAVLVRATSPRGASLPSAVTALVLGGLGALLDETIQHFLPMRTGDLSDVQLDLQAVVIGVVVAWRGLVRHAAAPSSWSPPLLAFALAVVWLGAFQHLTVGFGHAHRLDAHTTFVSRLTLDALKRTDAAQGAENAAILTRTGAMGYGIFLASYPAWREPFLYELRVHVYRRDRRLEKDDLEVACGEQRVIDAVFARSVAGTAFEWSPTLAARCDRFRQTDYASPVSDDIATSVTPGSMWAGVALLAAAALFGAWRSRQGRNVSGSHSS